MPKRNYVCEQNLLSFVWISFELEVVKTGHSIRLFGYLVDNMIRMNVCPGTSKQCQSLGQFLLLMAFVRFIFGLGPNLEFGCDFKKKGSS